MSGECDEHCLDCKCKPFLERREKQQNISFLGLDVDETPFYLYKDEWNADALIWFGIYTAQMHLNQDQVAALIPLLEHFVETGRLP